MGNQEIYHCIAPAIGSTDGYAVWRLFPLYPTLKNVVGLLLDSPEFFQMFWNSFKITAGTLAGQLLFGTTAAWGLSQYPFRGRKLIYLLFILMMMMPFQVMMLSEYLVLDKIGLLDTYGAVIWPGIFSTFSVFIMYRFFSGIPSSIIDAARVDGANEIQIFFRIGIPLGRAGILSAVVLSFLECWSMIEQPMTFFKTKSLWPLSLFLPQIDAQRGGLSLCASLVIVLPALFVFLSGQNYLEQGIAASAMKE
ncbi:MAG: carbohydrate ABC transporter permease [Eubacterium sp.]|nr:carbohydrate ABC transporter permease [Eubacterium sp.]